MSIKIGIIEDHPAMILGTRALLSSFEDLEVIYAAKSAQSFLKNACAVDVVLLDLNLGDDSTPTRNVKDLQVLGIPIVAYTAGDMPMLLREAAQAGISGTIRKSERAETVARAIRSVCAGEIVASTEWARAVETCPTLPLAKLTPRESQVLGLYASGETAEQVSELLFISRETVIDHIRRIRGKYAAAGRPSPTKVDLYRRAVEDGMLPNA